MAPNETQHLASLIITLTDEVRGYREETRVLNTKLFGDPESENEHGRIPALEKQVGDQEKRLHRQEKLAWGTSAVISFIVVASAVVYEITNTIKGH